MIGRTRQDEFWMVCLNYHFGKDFPEDVSKSQWAPDHHANRGFRMQYLNNSWTDCHETLCDPHRKNPKKKTILLLWLFLQHYQQVKVLTPFVKYLNICQMYWHSGNPLISLLFFFFLHEGWQLWLCLTNHPPWPNLTSLLLLLCSNITLSRLEKEKKKKKEVAWEHNPRRCFLENVSEHKYTLGSALLIDFSYIIYI